MAKPCLMPIVLLGILAALALPVFGAVPVITTHSPANTTHNTTEILLNVSTDVVSSVSYSLNSGDFVNLYTNYFAGSSGINVSEGANKLTIQAVNGSDSKNATIHFTADTAEPEVVLKGPEENHSTDSPVVEFSFLPTDNLDSSLNCTLYLNGNAAESLDVQNDTKARLSRTLGAGEYQWKMGCADDAGNRAEKSRRLVVETNCGLIAYNLGVQDSQIVVFVENTGTERELVDYKFSVNLNEVKEDSLWLEVGEKKKLTADYNFSTHTHKIGFEASAECGATDATSMDYTRLPGGQYGCQNPTGSEWEIRCDYTLRDVFQCKNNVWIKYGKDRDLYCHSCDHCGDGVPNCRETKANCPKDFGIAARCDCTNNKLIVGEEEKIGFYFYEDCKTECDLDCYYDYECSSGYMCSSYSCIPKPGSCGITIQEISYSKYSSPNTTAHFLAKVKNTGKINETVVLKLYLGGILQGTYNFGLNPGEASVKTFYYRSPVHPKKYTLRLNATTNCGASDWERADLEVYEAAVENMSLEIALITDVRFSPKTVYTRIGHKGTLLIDIKTTKPQAFALNVSGVPESWLNYSQEFSVSEKETVQIFITPDKPGEYNLTASLSGQMGNFSSTSLLKVRSAQFELEDQDILLILMVLVILALVIYIGHKKMVSNSLF